MRGDRRNDGYGIDVFRCENITCVVRTLDTCVRGQHMLQRLWALIAYRNDFAVGETMKVSDNVWSPIAIADDANFEHIFYFLPPVSLEIRARPLQGERIEAKERMSIMDPENWTTE